MRLYKYDYEEHTGVATLFHDSTCYGKSVAIMSGDKGTMVRFKHDDMFPNNEYYGYLVSAVQVPPGYTLELYGEDLYGDDLLESYAGELEDDGTVKCQRVYSDVIHTAKLYNHRQQTFSEVFPLLI